MVVVITSKLDLPSQFQHHHISSLVHGFLMEQLTTEMAQQLHAYRYNPLKLRVYVQHKQWYLQVVSLEASLSIELVKVFDQLSSLNLRYHKLQVPLTDTAIQTIDIAQLVKASMTKTDPAKTFKLTFVTPTTFKDGKGYDVFPDIRKILRSAMLTFDYFSEQTKIYDYETLAYLSDNLKIISYNLHSTKFKLEGSYVPGFKGSIIIKARGQQQILQLLELIFAYARLSGVGVKTSLGMGGIL